VISWQQAVLSYGVVHSNGLRHFLVKSRTVEGWKGKEWDSRTVGRRGMEGRKRAVGRIMARIGKVSSLGSK